MTEALRIAIVDDSEDDRAEVRRLLLRGGERRYEFTEADTGERGIALCRDGNHAFDCLVLDYNLPDMTAEDVLAKLVADDGGPLLPVIVLTGNSGGQDNPRLVLRAGAQDYLGKGWMVPENLTRAVESAIERFRMARDLRTSTRLLREREERLRVADRAKDEFLATLAHELRNPLAPVRNGVAILQSPGLEKERAERTLAVMDRQLGHMVRLIDDLLDVSRIGRGKIELQRVDVEIASVVRDAIDATRPSIDAAKHRLDVHIDDGPMVIHADPVRVAQVLTNVLNNAAKYTPNGGVIELRATCRDARAVISVRDNGVGISPAMLPEVFGLFTQVDSSKTRAQGGLGIGLSIARRLVELHGGTITATSAGAGCGSEFTIQLPLAAVQRRQPVEDAAPAKREQRRILIVDDNIDAAQTLALLLKMRGHEIAVAYDGLTALEEAREFEPDFVFLDIGLPHIDGYEVAQRLRSTPAFESVPIVALTGWGTEADQERSRAARFHGHLTKPVSLDALERCLEGDC